jgi:hemoglobin
MTDPVAAIYKEIGSDKPFTQLVEVFYEQVEADPVLRPLYPADLTMPKKHLAMFLIQRMGGPTTYSDERGHPRMRARHLPFKIGLIEKNAWMKNMNIALESVPEFNKHKIVLQTFFEEFATFMINQPN